MAEPTDKADTVLLDTDEGRRLLAESAVRQPILMAMFDYQQHKTHCGIQSCALLLAALHCGQACRAAAAGQKEFEQCTDIKDQFHGYAMFAHQATQDVITRDVVQTKGSTLTDVQMVLNSHGHRATAYRQSDSSVDEFRRLAVDALSHGDSSRGVIVNFQRYLLGQIGVETKYGHHSPLCAYHEETDRFLMLDTNPKHPKLWLKTDDLAASMLGVDVATEKSRGYVIMVANVNFVK